MVTLEFFGFVYAVKTALNTYNRASVFFQNRVVVVESANWKVFALLNLEVGESDGLASCSDGVPHFYYLWNIGRTPSHFVLVGIKAQVLQRIFR